MEKTKTVTSFYYSENPNGLRYHEINNSMCKLLVIHRTLIDDIEKLQTPALYILLGEDEYGEKKAYIGQTTKLYDRLKKHARDKNFWEKAFAIVSKDGKSFTTTVVKSLEHIAFSRAKDNNCGYILDENIQKPTAQNLSIHEKSSIEDYFRDIEFLVELAGCDIFKIIPTQTNKKTYETLYLKKKDYAAEGYYNENGFTVLKGSVLSKKSQTLDYNWESDRNKLINKYTEEIENGLCILKEDITLSSPSRAASFITGTSINGLINWKDKDGNTLGSKY